MPIVAADFQPLLPSPLPHMIKAADAVTIHKNYWWPVTPAVANAVPSVFADVAGGAALLLDVKPPGVGFLKSSWAGLLLCRDHRGYHIFRRLLHCTLISTVGHSK